MTESEDTAPAYSTPPVDTGAEDVAPAGQISGSAPLEGADPEDVHPEDVDPKDVDPEDVDDDA